MEVAELAIQKIEQAKVDTELRITRRVEVGTCAAHQGDVYVHRVADDHVRGKRIGGDRTQVALGVGSGSRHVAEGKVEVFSGVALPPTVSAPKNVDPMEMCGPVIVARDTWMLSHPEHAHYSLPAGIYQVTYQYDARTMRRVQD